METKKLTAESTPIFQEGVGLILSRWSALTAAVENEWGGRDSRVKANVLCTDVISFFTESKAEPLYIDDLENVLEEGLLSLNTLVEDGSIEEVAEKLMIMHEECLEGNYQSVEKLRTTNPPPVAHVRPYKDEDEDEDDDDDEDDSMDADNATNMMVDVPNSQSSLNPVSMPTDEPKPNQAAEAEDGWVAVSSRRNKVTSQVLSPYPDRQGYWQLLHESVGISAMHMQLLHDNKVIIFDRTDFGPSNLSLPDGLCRVNSSDLVLQTDCTAHSILYDINTNVFRPLMVQTDPWCSSGAVLPNGTLVQTGGYNDGDHNVRIFTPCTNEYCNWIEFPKSLLQRRWYATNQILPDGRIIIVGGRRQFNYEFYPQNIEGGSSDSNHSFLLNFLRETNDQGMENNLYPFLHLLPDGNLFIFANTRSILLDYNQNRVVKEFPQIPGDDPRNYPSTGSSVLLPLDENKAIEPEIMVCGGAPRDSFTQAVQGNFIRATSTCGRLKVSHANPSWTMEDMPVSRVMGDMILLPTGRRAHNQRRRIGYRRMGIRPWSGHQANHLSSIPKPP
ncbi:hypothetical protein CRYUN_Cryun08bG0021700 [Craigia yunnanensis]